MLFAIGLFVVAATLVPALAPAAIVPGKTSSHASPRSPSPTPTARVVGRTLLSEQDELSVERGHESDLFWDGLAQGAGRTIVGLAWPAAVVVLALTGGIAWRGYLNRGSGDDKDDDDHADAIAANTSFSVTVAELQEVTETAASLEKAFEELVTAKQFAKAPPTIKMMNVHVPPGTADIDELRDRVAKYARELCGVMLARQFEVLALSAVRRLTYGEALAEYTAARAEGYNENISTWLGFLIRTGLARILTTSTAMSSTVIEPTLLGFLVLGWGDSNGITANTMMRSDRGL